MGQSPDRRKIRFRISIQQSDQTSLFLAVRYLSIFINSNSAFAAFLDVCQFQIHDRGISELFSNRTFRCDVSRFASILISLLIVRSFYDSSFTFLSKVATVSSALTFEGKNSTTSRKVYETCTRINEKRIFKSHTSKWQLSLCVNFNV